MVWPWCLPWYWLGGQLGSRHDDTVNHSWKLLSACWPRALSRRFIIEYTPLRASHVKLVVKNPPASLGDVRHMGLIPGCGRSPAEGNCNPLQYSCLENPMDSVAWQATVHNVTQSQTWHAQYISNSKVVWWQLRLWLENPHKPNRAVFRVLDPEF